MAESLTLFIGKTQSKRKSNNSTDEETNSPDAKKQKEPLLSTSDESEHDISNDAIMTALDMTGNFSQKLQLILSNLNLIQKNYEEYRRSLAALDRRTKKLEDFKESTAVDLEKLNQLCSSTESRQDEHAAAL